MNDRPKQKSHLFLTESNVLATFSILSTKLCFDPSDRDLEARTVKLLLQLLSEPKYRLAAWDVLRSSKLLNVIVDALASQTRLRSLAASAGEGLKDYVRVMELACLANPHECVRHLSFGGHSYAAVCAFLPLIVQFLLLDVDLGTRDFLFNSFIRTVTFLFSDARNCVFFACMKPSPMQLLLDSLAREVPSDRLDVRLVALKGVIQVLFCTSEFSKVWIESFAKFDGPAICLSTVVEWCSMNESPDCSYLNETSGVVFDILCMLFSLPDKGREPSHSIYAYLGSFHWDAPCAEPGAAVYTDTLGLFGLQITVRASLVAMNKKPTLFFYFARLLISAIRIGTVDIVAVGLVSEELVAVLRHYVQCCSTYMNEEDFGSMITTIVRLCFLVCGSSYTYARQKSGAAKLCSLLVELSSSTIPRMLIYTVKTINLLAGFYNEKLFFKRLVSMKLFEELEKRLQSPLSDTREIQIILKLLQEICTRVPFLQGRLLKISETFINIIRTKVDNGLGLLCQCANILSFVMMYSKDNAMQIGTSLQRIFTQTDFQSSSSIISGCWAIQTCINSLQKDSVSHVQFVFKVDAILQCLKALCVNMGNCFASEELYKVDTCELYSDMLAYHRHQRDACGAGQMKHHYLLLCDFLVLLLHLLNLLQVNDYEVLRKVVLFKFEKIIIAGPFLCCRLYTSIVARAVIGMCSLSSYVFFAEIPAFREGRTATATASTATVAPITRQDLSSGWCLQKSYGDDLFATKKQRIVYSQHLQSLFDALFWRSRTAQCALLGVSILQLVLDTFSNCYENICTLVERRVITLFAELLAIAIAEDRQEQNYVTMCFEELVAVVRQLGLCGFSHSAILYLMQMCLRNPTVHSVKYESGPTATVLSTCRALLQNSIPSTQPMSFFGISAGFPVITRHHTCAVREVKEELAIYGGVDVPIQLAIPKPESSVSAVFWFFVERNLSLPKSVAEILLLSLFLDQKKICVLLLLSGDATLQIKVVLRGNRRLRSKTLPVHGICVPVGQWCMICMSVVKGNQYATSLRSKLVLNVRLYLYTFSCDVATPLLKQVDVPIEILCSVLRKVDSFFREVNIVSLGASSIPADTYPQQLLFGSLGLFAGSLSKLEVLLLFAMGSDGLNSRSFMDKGFVMGLYPFLANIVQKDGEMIMEEMILFLSMWIQSGISGMENQIWFSGSNFPFSNYCNKERHSVVVFGIVDNELCVEAHTEGRAIIRGDAVEKEDDNAIALNSSLEKFSEMRQRAVIFLRLSCDENFISKFGVAWANMNGPRFYSVTPAYSALDALGGGPSFFLWLASLQAPLSEAFDEAWACVCETINRHSSGALLFPALSQEGRNLGILLRAMLHLRFEMSSKVALLFCEIVGRRVIVRLDLLPLLLDFTLWSRSKDALQVILRKLTHYLVDNQYGYLNAQILQGIFCPLNLTDGNSFDCTSDDNNYYYGDGDGCYALDEFLKHLLMHFAESTHQNNWDDISLICSANSFLISFCQTALHLKRIMRAVLYLTVYDKPPMSDDVAVEWALGLLSVANSLDINGDVNMHYEGFCSDVLLLLSCPNEKIRCKALCILSRLVISLKQLDAMVNAYFARRAAFPNLPFLSNSEFDTIVNIIWLDARLDDIKQIRIWFIFLFSFFMQMPDCFQKRVLALLRDIIEAKGVFEEDFISLSAEESESSFMIKSVTTYMIGIFSTLPHGESSLRETLVKLLGSIAVYMLEISWGEEKEGFCGNVFFGVAWAVFCPMLVMINGGHTYMNDGTSVNKMGTLWSQFSVPCFYEFSLLAEGRAKKRGFSNDYLLFLRINAFIVTLINWCESENWGLDNSKVADSDAVPETILSCTYRTFFGSSLSFGNRHTGLRVALHVFECAQKLFFLLKAGVVQVSKKYVQKVSEELLSLQWKIVAILLYEAEKNDDDMVKKLLLLHLVESGSSQYGVSSSAWSRKEVVVRAPKRCNWKHVHLSCNTLLVELVKATHVEFVTAPAPWLIVLRAAFTFLNPSMSCGEALRNMALSICRVIRYNSKIWSIVKGGVVSFFITEMDAILNLEPPKVYTPVFIGIADHNLAAPNSDSFWGIELSLNGVAALEKYVKSTRSVALFSLNQYNLQTMNTTVSDKNKQAVGPQEVSSASMNRFHTSLLRSVSLYKTSVEVTGSAILAAYAAYRFSLLPWWGFCIGLYSNTPVPLNHWVLDRCMGTEWQRARLCRFIHSTRFSNSEQYDQLAPVIYRDGINFIDDVQLLKFYSVTAVPQLLSTNRAFATELLIVRCQLVLAMDRVPIILHVASQKISYTVEVFQNDSTKLGGGRSENSFYSSVNQPSSFTSLHDQARDNFIRPDRKEEFCSSSFSSFRRVVEVSSIRAVWQRRNLLQPCALELLLSTGETLFFAFDSEEVSRRVFSVLTNVAGPFLDKTLFLTWSNLKAWGQWWREGRISNFHYLMYLNFAAGRSYGDLRQYPIFPHVVADFVSDSLDLTSAAVFRCFGKPMGAQAEDRELKAIAKYNDIASLPESERDKSIDLLPYHYGSHYSPMGCAPHYLVRVQPFLDYFINMNSKLDDANRVFDSMATAYTISMGKDVKELLPELYCLPEVFVNLNHIPFGVKQDGNVVNDVQLPPWASTARELTQKLRQALESRYTSENLHLWIDLVFGYKQKGKEAVAAVNVFHPLTYEGFVDLSAISDSVVRNGYETQIDCFGQTPLQLFTRPHKQRVKTTDPPFFQSPCPTLRYDASNFRCCGVFNPQNFVPLGMSKVEWTIAVFPRSKPATAARGAEEVSERKLLPAQPRPIVLPSGCIPFLIVNDQLKECLCIRRNSLVLLDGKDLSREIASFYVSHGRISSFVADAPIVYVGMESGAIHVLRITNEEVNEVELSHENRNMKRIGIMNGNEKGGACGEVKVVRTRNTIRQCICILYGHTASVTALCVSCEWGILVSTAKDYTVGVWDTERRILLYTIPHPGLAAKCPKSPLTENVWRRRCGDELWDYHLISVNAKEGDIILVGHSANDTYAVRLYTINGSLVCAHDLYEGFAAAILSVGEVVLIAQGMIVQVLRERNLQWLCKLTHPGIEDSIESLALSPNGSVLAACDRKGNLVTWKVSF